MTQATASTPGQPLTDQMAGRVTAHFLLAIRKVMEASPGGGPDLKTLRVLLHEVLARAGAVIAGPARKWNGSAWRINAGNSPTLRDARLPLRAFGWQAHKMGIALRMRRKAWCGWRW